MQSDIEERFTSARLMRLKWKSRMKKMTSTAIITPDITCGNVSAAHLPSESGAALL